MSNKEKIKYLEAKNAYLREIVKERENILKKGLLTPKKQPY